MRAAKYFSIAVLCLGLCGGCIFRLYPPIADVVLTAPIYPDPRPEDCNLMVLTAPPREPYAIFAQVISYAGSEEMAERMEKLIKKNACEAGADAIVLLPMQHEKHINTVNVYPDWVTNGRNGEEIGDRAPRWVDKRYSVSQRALALVFMPEKSSGQEEPAGL
jgi:hypothetical protein